LPIESDAVRWSQEVTMDNNDAYENEHQARRGRALLEQLPAKLTPGMLIGLDHFHAGGLEAAERLLHIGEVGEGMTVVDFGAGLGGPARLAAAAGAIVVGIDASPSFVDLATALSARCRLSGRVEFRVGDMTSPALPDHFADRVMLIHAQMNIEDKPALARTIARILKPGGKLLAWEVCTAGAGEVTWPTPWSLDGADSHLVDSATMRAEFERAGLHIASWEDRSAWVGGWFRQAASAQVPTPSLLTFLERGPERAQNFARGITTGQLAVVEGVAHA
jgi:ubiquinone/menaquinone biosynthesis C-methylase UbiE